MINRLTQGSAIAILILTAALPSVAVEKRCGWLDNPTPANWWLTDADGRWTISVQGGYRAQGMEKIPDISIRDYVKTNGSYGYACACMNVTTDSQSQRIRKIHQFEQLRIKKCRQDRHLPGR